MEKSVREKDIELMCWFLELEFPKTRVKFNKNSKRFKKGVVIPHNYTGKPTQAYTYNDKEDMQILFPILRTILYKVFMFEEEDMNLSIVKHFNLI